LHPAPVLGAVAAGVALHRDRPTAAKVPMNPYLLLSPSQVSALPSAPHALQPGTLDHPAPVPVMAPVQDWTSAALTPAYSITHANYLLVLAGDN